MAQIKEHFLSPVGRLVQGDAWKPQTTNRKGELRVVMSGPNKGQPSPQTFISVAFEKSNPEFGAFYAVLDRVARQEWPQYFPVQANGQPATSPSHPRFSMKLKDGDGIDQEGKSNATKPGFAGCWVVSFASNYAVRVTQKINGSTETITDPNALKKGYFVRIAGNATGNDSSDTPGLYVNLDMIEICGYGPEISSGPDASVVFASAFVLPAGASAVPLAGPVATGYVAPAIAPVTATPAVATGYVAPAIAPVTATPAAPNPAFMVVPPPPGGGAIPEPLMTAAAGGTTRAQYIAAGWTDQQLVAQGFMIA